MMSIIIRKGRLQDAKDFVYINTFTWLTTYRGMLPDVILDSLTDKMEEKECKFAKQLAENNNLWIAEKDGEICGALTYGSAREDEYESWGEIYSIYILKNYQNIGIGKQLFLAGVNALKEKGFQKFIVKVLYDNKNAISFYEKNGGIIMNVINSRIANISVKEVIIKFEI